MRMPGVLQSGRSQRVRHDLATEQQRALSELPCGAGTKLGGEGRGRGSLEAIFGD